MSRKRSIVSTAFNQRKRICATVQNGENATAWEIPAGKLLHKCKNNDATLHVSPWVVKDTDTVKLLRIRNESHFITFNN